MINNINVEKARELLLDKVKKTELEEVKLEDSLDRILAKDYVSRVNIPDFRKSALDGFALNYMETLDIENTAKKFFIEGSIGAGSTHDKNFKQLTAIKIMTGAPIPEGYNTVIRKEDVIEENDYVSIPFKLNEEANIVKIGEDVKSGDIICEDGETINPGTIGVIASLGDQILKVYKKPVVGILNTGKELVKLGESLEKGQIYNSNYYILTSLLRKMGCIPVNLGIATDNVDDISSKIESNIDDVDMIITTGGASVGDYDFIYDVYNNISAEVLFKRVDMKPGTPMLSAYYRDKLLIGLSGNPGAAFISFDYILTPVIKKIRGMKRIENKKIKAVLTNDFNKKSKRRRLIRAIFSITDDGNRVSIAKNQKSGTLQSMTICNCLIDVKAPNNGLKAGEEVEIILLEGRDIR